jgi:hypothetical protein
MSDLLGLKVARGTHTLSSMESECIVLSEALRSVIPMMSIIEEMKDGGIKLLSEPPRIHCHVFEDNSGALEMVTVHKFRPRTKHLAVKEWHHFRRHASTGNISIHKIDMLMQPVDTLTKQLSKELFVCHRVTLMGW